MDINNSHRIGLIGKALDLLRQGLAPFVERELQSESERGKAVSPEILQRLSKDPNIADKPVGEWDVAALLKLMTKKWWDVFHEKLGYMGRNLASELIDWRNKWAHQTSISNSDVDRVFDSASRLLRAVSATQQADEIDGMREEFRQIMDEMYLHTKKKKDESLNADSRDFNIDGESMDASLVQFEYDQNNKMKIYQHYTDLIGEILWCEIYQVRRNEVILLHVDGEIMWTTVGRELGVIISNNVLHGRYETGKYMKLVLPRSDQSPRDWYCVGEKIRAVVQNVQWDSENNPQIIISRRNPVFMERLFEQEIPEIYEGIVQINRIAWEPDEGAIIAVSAPSVCIDPVAACFEEQILHTADDGSEYFVANRSLSIGEELLWKKIKVIQYSSNPYCLLERVFSPAKPIIINAPGESHPPRVEVIVKAEDVGQVVGRNGINLRLASRLVGREIDVRVSEIAGNDGEAAPDESP